jgi:hypothetical protein
MEDLPQVNSFRRVPQVNLTQVLLQLCVHKEWHWGSWSQFQILYKKIYISLLQIERTAAQNVSVTSATDLLGLK